jgi:choline transport protein
VGLCCGFDCYDVCYLIFGRNRFNVGLVLNVNFITLINLHRAPSNGGVYDLVGQFAPKAIQKYLSYIMSWMGILAWLTCFATLNFLTGTMIQSVAALWKPLYSYELWHTTLIVIGIGSLCTFLNTVGVKSLPSVELLSLFLHFFGILVFLLPLWLAPKTLSKTVFRTFEGKSGWGNIGLTCLVGQIGPLFSLLRSDGGTHICKPPRSLICSGP